MTSRLPHLHLPATAVLWVAFVFGAAASAGDNSQLYFQGNVELADVVRFRDLPTRLFLRPEFRLEEDTFYLKDVYVPLFVRVLDGNYDVELQRDAARSLERIAFEKLADPAEFVASVRSRLKKSNDSAVIRACAMTLVAVNDPTDAELLSNICRPEHEVVCQTIEPMMVSWKSDALLEKWRHRISEPLAYSRQLTTLACRALASADDKVSVSQLATLSTTPGIPYELRKAAAAAVATLDPQQAANTASELINGDLRQRVLATTLLQGADSPENLNTLAGLCRDRQNAVASLAWKYVLNQKAERLLSEVEFGRQHEDSNIRKVTIEVLRRFPNSERCRTLHEMLADRHIQVRNTARMALFDIAGTDTELKSQLLAHAGEALADPATAWQQLEQSLLLLGQLMHPEFQDSCLGLLNHDRDEVIVTAAWLLHLMPQAEHGPELIKFGQQQWKYLSSKELKGEIPHRIAVSEQMIFLFQVLAFTEQTEAISLCLEMLPKLLPTLPETRATGLWAAGIIAAKDSNQTRKEDVRAKITGRMLDGDLRVAEHDLVRASTALALGVMQDPRSIADLRKAYVEFGSIDVLYHSVNTSLELLGEEPIAREPRAPVSIGGWPIGPAGSIAKE